MADYGIGTMPYSPDSEREVLAATLLDEDCALEVLATVKEHYFYDARNIAIFKACCELERAGSAIDPVLVLNKFEHAGPFREYILDLITSLPTMAFTKHHIQQLKDCATRRQLIMASRSIIHNAVNDTSGDTNALLDNSEHAILAIGEGNVTKDFGRVSDMLDNSFVNLDRVRRGDTAIGIQTGFRRFDSYTTGLHAGEFVIIGARPAVGKTSLALNMAANIAATGRSVGLFSLEMQSNEIMNRLIYSTGRVRPVQVVNNQIAEPQWERIVRETRERITAMPLYLDDSAALTPIEMRAKARRLKHRAGLDVLFIDYLQLMSCGIERENRQQEITQISRDLKAMAKDLGIAVVALSQLSRKTTGHTGPPMLHELRESGSLEQDADVVAFLYDPNAEARHEQEGPMRRVSLIIAKQRNGPTGEIPLVFDSEITTFEEADLAYS